jgi:hypothetical protein
MPSKLNKFVLFLDLFLYLSFYFIHREVGGETMGDHVGTCRLRWSNR